MVYFSIKKTGRGAIGTGSLYELCCCVGALIAQIIIQGILGLSNCKKGGVRPKKVARLSGLEGVVKQAPTVAK
jgi:hypothetical protein